MNFITEEHIARLIFGYCQNILTEEDTKELTDWRSASPEHEALFLRITSQAYFESSVQRFSKTPEENLRNWETLQAHMHPDKRIRWTKRWAYAAAAVILLSVGTAVLYHFRREIPSPEVRVAINRENSLHPVLILSDGKQINLRDTLSRSGLIDSTHSMTVNGDTLRYEPTGEVKNAIEYHTLRIPYGSEYLLTLSDNSVVHLNAGSELTYPVRFSGQQRKVYLKGEAWFKVQKNSDCPFIVSVNELDVTVTGTTFNIRAYEDEKEIRTTLETGSVSISGKDRHADLSPGHQAIFDKQTTDLSIREVNTELYLGWKNGRIIYDNSPLENILRDLGRWYAFDVIYRKQELRSSKFSLNIQRHESISRVLELLANADNIRFEINGHTVIVQ